MNKELVRLGALFGLLGVLIGAFGRHGLESRISPHSLEVFEIGVRYHFLHALAILIVAALYPHINQKRAVLAGRLFGIGIVIFSGSLYILAVTGFKILGALTPIGGFCFIAGWIVLLLSAKSEPAKTD